MSSAQEDDKNKIGLLPAISYIVANIIGTGIFISPTTILKNTGSIGLSLIIWSICGLMALIGALCYIELGSSIRQSGKDYAYLVYVGWDALAFAFVFTECILQCTASCGVFMDTFGKYIMQGVSIFICLDEKILEIVQKMLGLLMLYMFTSLNFYSLEKYAAKLQVASMFFKVAALIVISCTGLYYIIAGRSTEIFQHAMDGSRVDPGGLVLALYGGLWAYSGWDTLNSGIEDMRNPSRDLPIAVLGGTVFVIVVYLLTNVGYFAVLGVEGLLISDAVVVTFCQKAFGVVVAGLVPAVVGLMASSTLNVSLFKTSRIIFVAARRRHFPSFLSCLSPETGSPRSALMNFAILATVMLLVGNLETFLKYVSFVVYLQTATTISALIWIRFKHIPVHPGAIKMPIILHFLFFANAAFLVIFPAYQNPTLAAVGCGFVVVGIIVFYAIVENQNLPWIMKKIDSKI